MSKTRLNFGQITFAMRAYYIVLLALINIYGLGQIKNYRSGFKPVYLSVAAVFDGLDYRMALLYSSLFVIASCFWAALHVTQRTPRIFVFISLLLYSAATISSGGLTHLYQFWLWSSFLLAWAPTQSRKSEASSQTQDLYRLSWWGAQSIVLLMYGLSGLWKLVGFLVQVSRGQTGILSPSGLSYHYASEVIRAGADPLLGPWLLAHEYWQVPMSFSVLALQLLCFVGIFKQDLRPLLGGALMLFHLCTFFFLAINYPTNFALIPVLFLLTPARQT